MAMALPTQKQQQRTGRDMGSSHRHRHRHRHRLLLTLLLFGIASPFSLPPRSADAIRVATTNAAADASSSASSATEKEKEKTVAVFALGSFWHAEAVFGCVPGVLTTTAGYTGGSKPNPEYRNVGDHAEAVQVEFDPKIVAYEKLLDVFWSSHDPTQVFGQGPDVGDQYRSVIFFQGPDQKNLAMLSKMREEAKLGGGSLTTGIEPAGEFFPAEPEHQKFELRRKSELMHLFGNTAIEEEFLQSHFITRLNAYVAGMCSGSNQRDISNIIDNFIKCRLNLQQVLHR